MDKEVLEIILLCVCVNKVERRVGFLHVAQKRTVQQAENINAQKTISQTFPNFQAPDFLS